MAEETVRVIKLVAVVGDKLISYNHNPLGWIGRDDSLIYRTGHDTVPEIPGSALFAFDTLEHAVNYHLPSSRHTLFYADAVLDDRANHWMSGDFSLDSIEYFWRAPGADTGLRTRPPEGTVFCKRIRLVSKVPSKEIDQILSPEEEDGTR